MIHNIHKGQLLYSNWKWCAIVSAPGCACVNVVCVCWEVVVGLCSLFVCVCVCACVHACVCVCNVCEVDLTLEWLNNANCTTRDQTP